MQVLQSSQDVHLDWNKCMFMGVRLTNPQQQTFMAMFNNNFQSDSEALSLPLFAF